MPESGALSPRERRILAESGFLPLEIRMFNLATAPDGSRQDINFNSGTFQDMIRSRKAWVARRVKLGWTPDKIRKTLLGFYTRRGKKSPFDFLKLEYEPPRKLSDADLTRKIQSRRRITMRLGTDYGRGRRPKSTAGDISKLPARYRLGL